MTINQASHEEDLWTQSGVTELFSNRRNDFFQPLVEERQTFAVGVDPVEDGA